MFSIIRPSVLTIPAVNKPMPFSHHSFGKRMISCMIKGVVGLIVSIATIPALAQLQGAY